MLRILLTGMLLVCGHAVSTIALDSRGEVLLSVGAVIGRTEPQVGQRGWEAFAGTGNRACRGTRPTDNNQSYYELFNNISSVEDCKALCVANQPRCKGMEYSVGRCEMWIREEGIASWFSPNLTGLDPAGFTCHRYGWPAMYLQPMEGGTNKACRGEHPEDKSTSYFDQSVVRNLEDCRALCVAADVCRGVHFSMYADGLHGRCEIWKQAIRATKSQSGATCLRFEPPAEPAVTNACDAPESCACFVQRDSNFCDTCPNCGTCTSFCSGN